MKQDNPVPWHEVEAWLRKKFDKLRDTDPARKDVMVVVPQKMRSRGLVIDSVFLRKAAPTINHGNHTVITIGHINFILV